MAAGLQNGSPIAVLGAGSWGTALAIQFARSGKPTRLWGRDPAAVAHMSRARVNARYLPGAPFPESLSVGADLAAQIDGALDVLLVVPSEAFRGMLERLQPLLAAPMRLGWATKGFEAGTGLLPNQVAHAVLGSGRSFAVLSGPTFAREVGAGLPTAMTVASADPGFAAALAGDLSSASFRAYTATDIAGVEVGGAVKNVLAVAVGLADGLGFGANTRVALITRGLTEMTRLGLALGAMRATFMGLAGLGDLVLTCTDDQSRNRRFGLMLAAGRSMQQAHAAIGQVVEGHRAAHAVHDVTARLNVEMPLCDAVYRILYEGAAPDAVVKALMGAPGRAEAEH
ncbi:MAG TPA: NAD(P)H-dependent glycerol-3-phosphate dehydrogenase [Steroidobacteraceae bacterium]|nr:NAD(P)H-dependent glycerol-3-phosphate dehydrogenase [Steroidobacteraceae bacterium]